SANSSEVSSQSTLPSFRAMKPSRLAAMWMVTRESSVGELIGSLSYIVGCRIFGELHGVDRRAPLEQCLGHSVPTVHHIAVRGENDRIREVGGVHEREMLDERAPRHRLVVAVDRFIELPDLRERHALDAKRAGEQHQPVDVPREQTSWRLAEVVLLAHRLLT